MQEARGTSMDEAEFDKFAEEYRSLHAANIRASGETPEYFAEYKIRDVARLVTGTCDVLRALDFGAGIGTSVPYFQKYFPSAELTCVDVSDKSLAIGAARFPGAARFQRFDGQHLPFPDNTFDVAYAACVFHHIDQREHLALLREMHRVLAPGGWLVVFEHNPLNPLTVRAVNTCAFDENARLIHATTLRARVLASGFRGARLRYRIFFPHALRHLRPLENHMTWLPLGAQYYVAAQKG